MERKTLQVPGDEEGTESSDERRLEARPSELRGGAQQEGRGRREATQSSSVGVGSPSDRLLGRAVPRTGDQTKLWLQRRRNRLPIS